MRISPTPKRKPSKTASTNQKLLNALPSGQHCKHEGQALVTTRKNEKARKARELTSAKRALESAGNAEVDFGKRTFLSMTGACAIAKSDGTYLAAKRKYDAAQTKVSIATGQHKAAEKAYNEAVAAAKKQMKECECDVQKKHADAWKKANAANASNQKGWTRATHMLCVAGGTHYNNCKGSTAPTVKKPTIDNGAKNANCETAGGIPPPKPKGFYKMKQGTCCCPSAERIQSREECKQAMRTLGLKHTSLWTGNTNGIPGGCGWRNYDHHNMHWNTHEPGRARKDMVPVCKR